MLARLAAGLSLGAAAGATFAALWLWRLEQSLGTSCDLGCVAFFPLFPALAVAGGVAGASTARRGWRATRRGWAALGVLAGAAFVLPQPLAWLLLSPMDLLGLGLWPALLVALAFATLAPVSVFLVQCRLFGGSPAGAT
jgi:hypothetical protein